MSATNVAPAVRELVEERVHSIEQLELLLFLHKRQGEIWAVGPLAQQLGVSLELTESALGHLSASGLVEALEGAPGWRFQPHSAELGQVVDQLAETYKTARVELIIQISTSAMQRVRNAGLRAFAQAFLVKGRKDRG